MVVPNIWWLSMRRIYTVVTSIYCDILIIILNQFFKENEKFVRNNRSPASGDGYSTLSRRNLLRCV